MDIDEILSSFDTRITRLEALLGVNPAVDEEIKALKKDLDTVTKRVRKLKV